jgi:SAM-dependent methyltransferase
MKEKVEAKVDKCILCKSEVEEVYDPQLKLFFYHCPICEFVYQDQKSHASLEEEKDQYDFHQNSFENIGYVNYLRRFLEDHVLPLKKSGKALDFGSGPGPVLYELLKEHFEEVAHYDPFYHPDLSALDQKYDVITSTEVVEHMKDPMKEFRRLRNLLKEDGYLVIMTSFRLMDMEEFLTWWYRRDSTHISFYHPKSFAYIAGQVGLKILKDNEKNVIILKRA